MSEQSKTVSFHQRLLRCSKGNFFHCAQEKRYTFSNIFMCRPRPISHLTISTELGEGVSLELDNTKDFILSLDIQFITNGSVSVILETTENGPPFIIHYVTSTKLIAVKDREITYGIGPRLTWTTLTRDLLTDLRKGIGLTNTKSVRPTKVGLMLRLFS